MLEPIEHHWRVGEPEPADHHLVLRGSPLTAETPSAHASRQARTFSYRDAPMYSVSVFVATDEMHLRRLLGHELVTRRSYGACSVGGLYSAGYVLLATHEPAHFDILLDDDSESASRALLARFAIIRENPLYRRGR